MIESRLQWEITNRQIERFRNALDVLGSMPLPEGVAPEFRKIEEDAMRSVLGDLEQERVEYEARTKRFFRCLDDGDGDDDYAIVAFDLDDARNTIREAGIEFYNPNDDGIITGSLPFDQATWLTWRELSPGEAAAFRVDTTDDRRGRGVIPLSDCDIGEFFGKDW